MLMYIKLTRVTRVYQLQMAKYSYITRGKHETSCYVNCAHRRIDTLTNEDELCK